jgi:hypothetical protein
MGGFSLPDSKFGTWDTPEWGKRPLERNLSPYILMNIVEGRHSLMLAST